MIIFNIVSAVWAWLAWWKKKETYTPIWTDVCAAGVAIMYIVKQRSSSVEVISSSLMTC